MTILDLIIIAYIFVIMMFIAGIHLYWALGGLWPGKTPEELSDIVIGAETRMPSKGMTIKVTIIFILMAIIPLFETGYLPPLIAVDTLKIIEGIFAFVFLLRGILSYLKIMSKHMSQRFNSLNRRIYGPLCISLGFGYIYLLF